MMKHVIPTLLGIFSITKGKDLELLILHNNDMHARYNETTESLGKKYVGGFARTAAVVNEARHNASIGDGPPVLFLNAGDTFTGTIWHNVHGWKIASELLNVLAPDITCLGNHEFDDSQAVLELFINALEIPIVTANIKFRNANNVTARIKPYHEFEIDGTKIGVIGYLTPETKLMAILTDIEFEDEVDALRRVCKELKQKGINIIIALGHSGFETDKRIAREVGDVDVVVGGHTNTFLWNGDPPDAERPEDAYPTMVRSEYHKGKMVPVVQAYAHTKYIGWLRVEFDAEGNLKKCNGQPIFLDSHVPQDPQMLALVKSYQGKVQVYYEKVVGQSRSNLDGESCRKKECNFGNLVADSLIECISKNSTTEYWSPVSIGLINSGAIRGNAYPLLHDGNLLAADLLGGVPFTQKIVTFTLTGKHLIETLEAGARSDGETSRGEFLQVSGLRVVYDFARPSLNRVVSVKARCCKCFIPRYEEVQLNETYYIVSTSYLLTGGDGHVVIRDQAQNAIPTPNIEVDCIFDYLDTYRIVTPQEEERLLVYNHPQNPIPLPSGGVIHLITSSQLYIFSPVVFVYVFCKHLNL